MLLGTILFLWQIPHFLALVWVCRDDYAKAGFRMLPLIDPAGHLTCLMIVLYSLALLPLGLAVTFAGLAGYLFAAVSLLLGLGLFLLALQLRRAKTPRNARRVFLASLAYLPLLMLFMVLDGRPRMPSDPVAGAKPAEVSVLAATTIKR
jgi:heme O synthase-like polyprenyltransferase